VVKTFKIVKRSCSLNRYYRVGQNFSNISFVFWAMELQEKLLLRFTDL
jgi:hypothetical protein